MSFTFELTLPGGGGGGALSDAGTVLDGTGVTLGPVVLSASIFSPPQPTPPPSSGATPLATATATQSVAHPATLPALTFPSSAVPTNEAASLLITGTQSPSNAVGDVARFLLPVGWPTTLAFFDFPAIPVNTDYINNELAESVAGSNYSVPTSVRTAAILTEMILGFPYNDPRSITINQATFATNSEPGSATMTIFGTLTLRQSSIPFGFLGFFGTMTTVQMPLTIVVQLMVNPSHDASNPLRTLSIAGSTISLAAPGSVIPNFLLGLIKDAVESAILNQIETALNKTIFDAVTNFYSDFGGTFSPGSVVSAFSATLSATFQRLGPPAGLMVSLIVASFTGSPIGKTLRASVDPFPVADEPRTYVATFTDASTGAVVPGLDAVIANYTASGTPQTDEPTTPTSTSLGTSTFNDVTLRNGPPEAIVGTKPPIVIVPRPLLGVTDPNGVYAELIKGLL